MKKDELRYIECPICKGDTKEDAKKCKHCGCILQDELLKSTRWGVFNSPVVMLIMVIGSYSLITNFFALFTDNFILYGVIVTLIVLGFIVFKIDQKSKQAIKKIKVYVDTPIDNHNPKDINHVNN